MLSSLPTLPWLLSAAFCIFYMVHILAILFTLPTLRPQLGACSRGQRQATHHTYIIIFLILFMHIFSQKYLNSHNRLRIKLPLIKYKKYKKQEQDMQCIIYRIVYSMVQAMSAVCGVRWVHGKVMCCVCACVFVCLQTCLHVCRGMCQYAYLCCNYIFMYLRRHSTRGSIC